MTAASLAMGAAPVRATAVSPPKTDAAGAPLAPGGGPAPIAPPPLTTEASVDGRTAGEPAVSHGLAHVPEAAPTLAVEATKQDPDPLTPLPRAEESVREEPAVMPAYAAPLARAAPHRLSPLRLEVEAAAPSLKPGRTGNQQLREAIVRHEAAMKKCVDRQLKLVPSLRSEGTLFIEVDASGYVTQAGVRGDQLQGTALEGCLRALAVHWRFPRTTRAYAVEAPLKVSGVESRRP